MSQVFISYRRDDSADVAGRIYDRLVQKYGPDGVFKDVDSIPLGIDFRDHLGDAVGRCQVFLAVIGPQWLRLADPSGGRRLDDPRDFVRLEIEAALRRSIPVIPVFVGGAGMPGHESLPLTLQALAFRNGIAVRRDPDFHHDMDRLLRSLEQLLESQTRLPAAPEPRLSILVVDDEKALLSCYRLEFEHRMRVYTASTAAEGLRLFFEHRPDVVILDVRLPDMSGLDLFRRLHESDAKVPVILVTGHGTAATAIEAMRLGAFEYLVKPVDIDQLTGLVTRALKISQLMRVPARIAEDDEPADDSADVLVGSCPAMQGVYKAIGRVAPQDVTVLITGESGTGKGLVARAIYHYSRRSAGPFLAINCAAIPENLLESELFGHEKGAFTGAHQRRIGKFEQFHGGTLFLDEIGDMPPLTQTKVLRVLQDQQFQRVGGNEMIQTDVRLIAATNRDLEAMVAAGTFRNDLYYRLNVSTIRLPPLRDRGNDVSLLLRHYLSRFGQEMGKGVQSIAPDAVALLEKYLWPGNVAELQSVLKQALLQTTGPVLLPDFLPEALRSGGAQPVSRAGGCTEVSHFIGERLKAGTTALHGESIAWIEGQLFAQVLRHTGGSFTQAARVLGITRRTLRNKLVALGLAESLQSGEVD
jgi:two-component system nitrogen regulation response regulator GlnG